MDEQKYALTIEEQDYAIPASIVKIIGEEDFSKLIDDKTDSETRYKILKKLDYIYSNYVGQVVDSDYFKGRGVELSHLVNLASFLAERKQYDKANNLLYKSIKTFGDIYNDNKENYSSKEY